MGWHTNSDLSARGRNIRSWLIQAGIVFVAYYLAGKLGQASAERSSNLGPLWPAFGIALAAFLRLGNGIIPVVAASAFLVAFQSPVPTIAAAGQALSTTFAAFCGSYLLGRVSFDCSFVRQRDAFNFILLGAFASSIISASLGTAVLYLAGITPYSNISHAWLVYWMGDGTGVLLATPLALAVSNFGFQFKLNRFTEYAALNLLLLIPCLAIFGNLGIAEIGQDCLTFSVLPFIMWAALRFGVLGAASSTVLIATIATVATANGDGPFSRSEAFTNAALLDVFYAILSVTGIVLAALIAERTRAEAQRDELIRERAASQAREEVEKEAALLRDELAHLSRVEMLNALSGALAHEINQPLAAIRINAEAAMFFSAKQPVPLEELGAALHDILEDGKRAGEVLKQARAFVKKVAESHQEVELNAAVQDVARLVQGSAVKKGIQLDISLGSQSKPISGDRVQIQQVVMNLLMNACEAVEKRERSFRHVRLTTSFLADTAIVAVTDTGLGVSEEGMARLFEPFYTTKQGGMGLGLVICRSIVQAHQGTLTATKNPDGGITFSAVFPLAGPASGNLEEAQEVRLNA